MYTKYMTNPPYPVTQIAKFLLKKADSDKVEVTQLKLQKMLYYAQGWYLANFDKPLFNERILAWKFGPAIDEIYQKYKSFGKQPITQVVEDSEISDLDEATKSFLTELWDVYKPYSSGQLVTSTHLETPWNIAREDIERGENSESVITTESLKDFFKGQLNGKKSEQC